MIENKEKRPGVGVGVYILREGKVLLGKRKNSHGAGSWCPPGGHIEFGEDIFNCAIRETLEEAGVTIKNLKYGPYTNDVFEKEGKHYVTLAIIAEYDSGEAELKEPEKCEEWKWFDWNSLPTPLFLPTKNLVKLRFNPFKK